MAVMVHEQMYTRYSEGIVWNQANTVYTQMMRNTHEPRITITVGTRLLPRARDAAMVQSMNAEKP